jgi:hypothetical protein
MAPSTPERRFSPQQLTVPLVMPQENVRPRTNTSLRSAPRHRGFSTNVRVASGERQEIRVQLEAITTATLEVYCTVEGALITVDGAPFAMGSRAVGAGAHEIVVNAVGYEPFRRRVTLAPESTLRVDASLTRVVTTRPLHANPLFWTAVVGGVSVISTGVVLAVVLSGQAPEFNTTTGITIQALSGGGRF